MTESHIFFKAVSAAKMKSHFMVFTYFPSAVSKGRGI